MIGFLTWNLSLRRTIILDWDRLLSVLHHLGLIDALHASLSTSGSIKVIARRAAQVGVHALARL